MDKNYTLHLPEWGPYNKIYLGTSHIADKKRGLRFDLNLFPGYFRRSVMSVRDLADSGVKMMGASKKLTRFVYRYELEWKDRVYVDAHFESHNNVMIVTCDFVNNTARAESLSLNAVMSMKGCTLHHKDILPCEVAVRNGIWVDALDYDNIALSQTVASDGLYLGECRGNGFVGGSCIGAALFGKCNDRAEYRFEPTDGDALTIRYRGEGTVVIRLGDDAYTVRLPYLEEIGTHTVAVKHKRYTSLVIEPQDAAIDFDGFVIGGEATFSDHRESLVPTCDYGDDGLSIRFGNKTYTITTDCEDMVVRTLHADDVGQLLTSCIHNHVSTEIGDGKQPYIDLFMRPIFVQPHTKKTVTLTITAPPGDTFVEKEPSVVEPVCNPSGEKYRFSQKLMSAVTLTNVVWPLYTRRGYILHNTPGRNWDTLYTWDSGFIGMGLLQLDAQRAKDCLNTYLTPVGDKHSPCILHGTPLPIQIFLFAEIFYKTSDVEFLSTYYPMIYQQYRFFADKRKQPDAKATGMFALWDLFYNSGGWDDYPTQKYVHEHGLEDEVCPVINTAFTVLFAKILKNLAVVLSLDTQELEEDIAFYSHAVNTYAWDEDSGYYGYVRDDGRVLKIDGINADMGMDGITPYIAGISDAERSARMIRNVKEGMLTPIGVSVVDTRAPYYREDGYWNGSIWMPHQWILWKACLDNGEVQLARQIAETALELWERETAYTYNCYEHFMIANGRGGGFHQFSGLSTPVLMWFAAYYQPHTVTGGFMTVITNKTITETTLEFDVISTAQRPVVLVCMPEQYAYDIKTSGRVTVRDGMYTIEFDGPISEKIVIRRRNEYN